MKKFKPIEGSHPDLIQKSRPTGDQPVSSKLLEKVALSLESDPTSEKIAHTLTQLELLLPAFSKQVSGIAEETLRAVQRLLGMSQDSEAKQVSVKKLRKEETTKERVARAHEMLERLRIFLTTNAAESISAQIALNRDPKLEERRLLRNRKEGMRDERDTALYEHNPYRPDLFRGPRL